MHGNRKQQLIDHSNVNTIMPYWFRCPFATHLFYNLSCWFWKCYVDKLLCVLFWWIFVKCHSLSLSLSFDDVDGGDDSLYHFRWIYLDLFFFSLVVFPVFNSVFFLFKISMLLFMANSITIGSVYLIRWKFSTFFRFHDYRICPRYEFVLFYGSS